MSELTQITAEQFKAQFLKLFEEKSFDKAWMLVFQCNHLTYDCRLTAHYHESASNMLWGIKEAEEIEINVFKKWLAS